MLVMLTTGLLWFAIDKQFETPQPAPKSPSCYVIRRAVAHVGEDAVLNAARAQGFSEIHIQTTALRCLRRKV